MANILLIEDDLKFARMVEKIMTPHGHTVCHAPNGLEGLKLARQCHPDIILLDMNLPDLTGPVIAVNLRGSIGRGTIPIVALTAENGERAKRIALGVGCDDFISKPIDTRAFPGQIAALLQAAKPPDADLPPGPTTSG